MAKLLIDVKDKTKDTIVRRAKQSGKSIKAYVLDLIGIKDE